MRRWYLMFPAVMAGVLSCAGHACAQKSSDTARSAKADDLSRAKELYRRDCLVCHGATGDGRTDILRDRDLSLPDWSDPKSLDGRADQQLFNVIRFGRGKMPAESAGRADDTELRGLVRYIRTLARDEAGVSSPAESTASKR